MQFLAAFLVRGMQVAMPLIETQSLLKNTVFIFTDFDQHGAPIDLLQSINTTCPVQAGLFVCIFLRLCRLFVQTVKTLSVTHSFLTQLQRLHSKFSPNHDRIMIVKLFFLKNAFDACDFKYSGGIRCLRADVAVPNVALE